MMNLDELERLERAATPGPWASFADTPEPLYGVASIAGDRNTAIIEICCEPAHDERSADMALIAAARSALPALIRIARAAMELSEANESLERRKAALEDLNAALAALEGATK